jgi:NAD(P)-dependent dehydrogenase (short-subunit alcohol dehydrogenase family)
MTRSSNQRPGCGQTVLITGGTGGFGFQTARVLVRRGANVIITGREPEAGERAAATI